MLRERRKKQNNSALWLPHLALWKWGFYNKKGTEFFEFCLILTTRIFYEVDTISLFILILSCFSFMSGTWLYVSNFCIIHICITSFEWAISFIDIWMKCNEYIVNSCIFNSVNHLQARLINNSIIISIVIYEVWWYKILHKCPENMCSTRNKHSKTWQTLFTSLNVYCA